MNGRWCPLALSLAVLLGAVRTFGAKRTVDCGCAGDGSSASDAEIVTHDPSLAKDGKLYVLFSTGIGISMRTSRDLKTWSPDRRVFETPPVWAGKTIVGFRDHIWAPDVSRFGGKWHLYYAISTFGKNRSAIGHATNETLDPESPKYQWVDEGAVIQSYPTDDFNAIDPNVVLDAKGAPWLSFGSFWNGLRLVPLDRGGRVPSGGKPLPIAGRPHEGPQQPGAIEAPFIVWHGGSYYLFASFDFCCRGAASTYNVRVARAREVTGPYFGRDGKPMTEGGGTKILESGARWRGPGGQSVFHEGRNDTLVFHAYDAEDRGTPKLRLAKITWDREGWPTVAKPQ